MQNISGGQDSPSGEVKDFWCKRTHLLVKVEQQVLVERATQERAKQSSTVDTTICKQWLVTRANHWETMETMDPLYLTFFNKFIKYGFAKMFGGRKDLQGKKGLEEWEA